MASKAPLEEGTYLSSHHVSDHIVILFEIESESSFPECSQDLLFNNSFIDMQEQDQGMLSTLL